MRNKSKTIIAVLALAALSGGCATKSSFQRAGQTLEALGGSVYAPRDFMDVEITIGSTKKKISEHYFDYLSKSSGEQDQLIGAALAVINSDYEKYANILSQGRATMNVMLEMLDAGATGASVIVAPATTKSILGASSLFIQDTRKSLDNHVFQNQLLPAILARIEARRAEVLKVVRKDMETRQPFAQQFSNLQELYKQGSLRVALYSIVNESAQSATSSAQPVSASPTASPTK